MNSFSAGRMVRKPGRAAAVAALSCAGLVVLTGGGEALSPEREARRALKDLPAQVDASPLPNYKGDFVSIGPDGRWRQPSGRAFAGAAVAQKEGGAAQNEPAADCSPEAITYYAVKAPAVFQIDRKGLLYGVETHTSATRVWKMPGYNSCALVVYAILKRAGCRWAKYTANAKAIFDMARASGWRLSDRQTAGCIVAWNSRWKGARARIGDHRRRDGKVSFRHVGIATGSWMAVDNTSFRSRPEAFITMRPIRYERPIFLCPPLEKPAGRTRTRGRKAE